MRKKERNKREKRKGSRKKKENFVQLKLKVRRLAKNRIQLQLISHRTCAVSVYSHEQDIKQGTGAEWVECVCGRWLHEECI